jgi:hypothetical protein
MLKDVKQRRQIVTPDSDAAAWVPKRDAKQRRRTAAQNSDVGGNRAA